MAIIKTCEEYILRELENTQRENELLKAEKQKLEEQNKEQIEQLEKENNEVIKENERLKDFIKKLVDEAKFNTCCDGQAAAIHIDLYGWHEGDKELMNELKKYKDEEN